MKLGTLEIQLAVRITVFGKLVIIMLGYAYNNIYLPRQQLIVGTLRLDIFGIQGTVSLIPDLIMACRMSLFITLRDGNNNALIQSAASLC